MAASAAGTAALVKGVTQNPALPHHGLIIGPVASDSKTQTSLTVTGTVADSSDTTNTKSVTGTAVYSSTEYGNKVAESAVDGPANLAVGQQNYVNSTTGSSTAVGN